MPNEPHQRNYLLSSFETPSTIPPTNPTKTKPLTPKESKRLCLTNMLRSRSARTYATCRHLYGDLESIFAGIFDGVLGSKTKQLRGHSL